jgi:hypothetical protein
MMVVVVTRRPELALLRQPRRQVPSILDPLLPSRLVAELPTLLRISPHPHLSQSQSQSATAGTAVAVQGMPPPLLELCNSCSL